MKPFMITWKIEVNAENSIDAAQTALEIMRDINSEALSFDVTQLSTGEETNVDLMEEVNVDS